ncbi:MAG: T9SS type A sorting domain-containing protein [Crocinitomicaceae bacterium]|nr:T9SS type A sorting domain-containing protein [Crocinitomicaceae bacterium]
MKKVLLLSGVLTALSGMSQTFTVDDTLGLGMSTNYFVMDSNAVSYSAVTGTGVTWDYDTLWAYETATNPDNIVDASSSIYAPDFTNAAYNDDLSNGVSIFFSNSPDSMTVHGYVFTASGNEVIVRHSSNPLKAIVFPMAVGDSYTDAIVGEADIMGNTFPSTGTGTVTCDGFGTLKVSGNTHTNILRIKLVEILDASITIPFPPMTITGTVTRTVYSYYDLANDKQPIFVHGTIDITSDALNDNYTAVYYSGTPANFLGSEEMVNTTFSVYPNPANNVLTITTAGTSESINIFNAAGQVVFSVNNPATTVTVDVATLPAGIYVIQVTTDGVISQEKLVVE